MIVNIFFITIKEKTINYFPKKVSVCLEVSHVRLVLDVNLKTRFFEGQNCLNLKIVKKIFKKNPK